MSDIEGLGDIIASLTKKVGIQPCKGCKERRDWLNTKFPNRRKKSCGGCKKRGNKEGESSS